MARRLNEPWSTSPAPNTETITFPAEKPGNTSSPTAFADVKVRFVVSEEAVAPGAAAGDWQQDEAGT